MQSRRLENFLRNSLEILPHFFDTEREKSDSKTLSPSLVVRSLSLPLLSVVFLDFLRGSVGEWPMQLPGHSFTGFRAGGQKHCGALF